jgi:hypothetical protein
MTNVKDLPDAGHLQSVRELGPAIAAAADESHAPDRYTVIRLKPTG